MLLDGIDIGYLEHFTGRYPAEPGWHFHCRIVDSIYVDDWGMEQPRYCTTPPFSLRTLRRHWLHHRAFDIDFCMQLSEWKRQRLPWCDETMMRGVRRHFKRHLERELLRK